MTDLRAAYLAQIGIDTWVARDRGAPPAGVPGGAAVEVLDDTLQAGAPATAPASIDVAELDWDALEAAVSRCTLCSLHGSRTRTVFGVGNRSAQLLIVGEAPGADEDRQGEPFVGRAGQLLNAMLRAIGFAREDVFIANILKCRPPGNRDPKAEESASCAPYLQRQIALLQPRVVLALGRISAQFLLQSELPVGRLRGQMQVLEPWGLPLIVTYHPAYLLRSPAAKSSAWQDLLRIKALLKEDR